MEIFAETSLRDMDYAKSYPMSYVEKNGKFEKAPRKRMTDAKAHDDNFAFLSTTLSKLHEKLHEPKHHTTYMQDVPVEYGGGFVDYVSYFSVDYAGIMNEFRNVVSNNANYIPRVNAGLSQNKVNVYTFQVAYDLRFIELEKMKKLTLQKSIEEIYRNAIVAGFDFFAQKIAYTGINGDTGLFNSANVYKITIDNSSATSTHKGFAGMTDGDVVAFFNGVFETFLKNSGNNFSLLPDTILVPSFVGSDLSSRFSTLYTSTLRQFIIDHNLGKAESDGEFKLTIRSRSDLDDLGTNSVGRIVAYKKDRDFVRMDMPYPIQHYITLPNIDKMGYTSAFVGQVSTIQMPYNTSDSEFGAVLYADFTK